MAVRTSMASLITRLRRLIGDTAGASQVWDDQALQDAFDLYQSVQSYARLQPVATIQPGGTRVYLDFYSEGGVSDWEENDVLTDASFNVLTPSASDRITGHWQFASDVGLVVWLSGRSYDLYAAAADVCEQWAALVKLEFDVKTQGRDYARMQQFRALLDLAAQLRRKATPQFAAQIRTDVAAFAPLAAGFLGDPGNDLGRGRVRG